MIGRAGAADRTAARASSGPASRRCEDGVACRESTSAAGHTSATRRTSSATGKSFFPYAMFHDTVMSLVVVCVIVGLAVRLVLHRGRHRRTRLARPPLHRRSRSRARQLRAAPRLVLLLPLLSPADLQVARTPSSSARSASRRILLVILIALPFVDVRRERRLAAPAGRHRGGGPRRDLDGHAHLQGRDGEEALGSEHVAAVPEVGREPGVRGRPGGGRRCGALRAVAGCLHCHTYLGAGSSNLGAPDLSASARRAGASPTSSATSRTRRSSETT